LSRLVVARSSKLRRRPVVAKLRRRLVIIKLRRLVVAKRALVEQEEKDP
jgi:hypothetical protein